MAVERTEKITIRYTAAELDQLDKERGDVERSVYIRRRSLNWKASRNERHWEAINRIKGKLTDINQEFSRLHHALYGVGFHLED